MPTPMPDDSWPTLRFEQVAALEAVLPLMPVPFGLKDLMALFPGASTRDLETALDTLVHFGRVGQMKGGYYWRAM